MLNREFDEIVRKAVEGRNCGVEEVLHRLKPLILSYSKRYGGIQGRDEDAYQEGMMEILEALRDFDPQRGVPFLGYIQIRIKHYYQNRRRKERHHISLNQTIGGEDATATLEDLLMDEEVNIEELTLKQEEKRLLMEAIEDLSPPQQEVIRCYYFERKTHQQIGAYRGTHPISVAKTKATALKNLHHILKNLK